MNGSLFFGGGTEMAKTKAEKIRAKLRTGTRFHRRVKGWSKAASSRHARRSSKTKRYS